MFRRVYQLALLSMSLKEEASIVHVCLLKRLKELKICPSDVVLSTGYKKFHRLTSSVLEQKRNLNT